jgi:hypothetical protein
MTRQRRRPGRARRPGWTARRAVAELRRKVGLEDVTVNVTVDDVTT